MADISSQVDLSDPLGQPKIVTGTEYMDALARLGYNRENMFSPLPMITKNIQALTSLVDQNYDNQMKWQASQAQIKETLARAGNIDSQTAYNNQALDLRLKDIDLQNKERQQNLDFATEAHPTVKRMLDNKGKQSDLDIQRAERSSKDEADSLDLLPQATAELPDPDDPDYVNKRDLWRIKYNRLLTNPTTKNRMEGEYQAIDSIYQGRISTQQTNTERKEFSDLQTGGFIPKVLNPDAAMRGPDKDSFLTRGRMLQARQQVEMVAAQLPDGDPYKDKLQTILNEADTHTKSDTGVQDIMAGKSSIFDTNGHLTGTSLAAAQQAQARATQLGTAAKPETEVKIPFGQPSQKGEYPGAITFKGLTPGAAEAKATEYGLTKPTAEAPGTPEQRFLQNIQDPQIRALGERLARKEITYQQFVEEMKKIPPPSPISQSGMPGGTTEGTIEAPSTTQTGRPGAEDRLATSNNDYSFPSGAPDVMGIDRNVWANVMSEEGREFGKDGSHDSVFGLWADAPGVESAAYRAVREHGPDSLPAYNAVTSAWTKAFLSQSRPWDLNSPGLQEMVIADSQHRGGAAARAIINQMGGYAAINSMDPADAIRTYSELRKPLWPGNNRPFADGASDRVTREMHWALRHDQQLARTQQEQGGSAS